MSVVITDDILSVAGISSDELKLEIAIVLFEKYKISIGKARSIAGMHLIQFQRELASRGICVHYDVEDFQEDLKTLKRLGEL